LLERKGKKSKENEGQGKRKRKGKNDQIHTHTHTHTVTHTKKNLYMPRHVSLAVAVFPYGFREFSCARLHIYGWCLQMCAQLPRHRKRVSHL